MGREVANLLDCYIVVSEFELQSLNYVHFWISILAKGMNSLFTVPINWLKSIPTVKKYFYCSPTRMTLVLNNP